MTKPRPIPKVESWHMTDLAREAMERERSKQRARYESNRDEILAKARAKNAANRTTKVDQRTPDEVEQGRIRYKERQDSNAKLRSELRQAMIATGLDPIP